MDETRVLLRHYLAALAYRTQKALRGAPAGFAAFRAGPQTRTPQELIRHMGGLINYALWLVTTPRPVLRTLATFDEEVTRFHQLLGELADHIAGGGSFGETSPAHLLQGPLADAMTHAGQLALLRRLAGSPVPPEDFVEAAIDPANVGPDQPPPASPDREWPEAPPGWVPPPRSSSGE
jgi:hypothetical protein